MGWVCRAAEKQGGEGAVGAGLGWEGREGAAGLPRVACPSAGPCFWAFAPSSSSQSASCLGVDTLTHRCRPGGEVPTPLAGLSDKAAALSGAQLSTADPARPLLSFDFPAVRPPLPGHAPQCDLPPHDPVLGPGCPQPPHLGDRWGQGLQHEAQAEECVPKRPGQGGPDHR